MKKKLAVMALAAATLSMMAMPVYADDLVTVGYAQVGHESDWRTANTQNYQDVFSEENGYELIFDDAQQKQEYQQYVKSVTPTHNLWTQMGKAFLTGGIICCIGQGILNYTGNVLGMDPQTSGSWCSLLLVFLSVVLTAFHIYPKIAKWGGAGALVPITGFANSVTAPAVEYQKEGQVFGIGCKIFTIAGPVILYGIFSSWGLGLILWVLQMFGIRVG